MGPGAFRGDAYTFKQGKASYNIWFASLQIGRSLVGIHASDISRLTNYLENWQNHKIKNIAAVAKKELCPALLHAAVFDKRISKIALIEPFISYRSIVMNRYYKPSFILSSVAGSLKKYDLPDLCAAVAPRRLHMVNVTDHNGKLATKDLLEEEMAFVKKVYAEKNVSRNFEILNWDGENNFEEIISTWFK